jgi:hypothetical protein
MLIDKEKINEAYGNLPEKVREIFDSEETALAISEIGKKNNLHIDQLGVLTNIVHTFILGLTKPSDFDDLMVREMGISADTANLIVYDLNQKIFQKIRNVLVSSSNADSNARPTINTEVKKTELDGAFAQKMSGTTVMPKEKVEVKAEVSDNGTAVTPKRDPYREPTV